MRALILLSLLAGCTSLPADTSRADRALAEALAGRNAGAPQRCVDRSTVSGPQIVDDHRLIYIQSSRRIWVNTLASACPSLRTDSVLVVRAFGTQMCENDQFQPRQPQDIVPGPICRFGPFTPYDKPKR
ncbi:DUF6491 family protein [Sphingomonas sp. PB4P5]|uniref:DUF6491 family protein n=1 Tax=Parasphingomonas puruogangriensis TaxID=3096155 RepID=UPI002FCC27AA